MSYTYLISGCNCLSQVYDIHSWKLGKTLMPRSALPSSCQRGFSPDPEKAQLFLKSHHFAKVRRPSDKAHFPHEAKSKSQG